MLNFSTNVSSLIANQGFANANANNIANVNTDGFVPTQTNLTNASGSVTASFSKADNNGSTLSQTDLSKEIPDQIIIQNTHEAQASAIKTQDQMIGSLLDIIT
ncbi:hypothetical protein JHD50_06840 [Sulfurimonas sp. MAG313]|nr:hypothetical protein [Sulfurimonas sp. MAG313]MDF1881022.1 hypothetical protein [Sulfurimonas sp. MAG313]